MKTAISLPDEVFHEAEQLARAMNVSRSELYATALRRFVEHERNQDVTERLNRVYATAPSELDPFMYELTVRTLLRNEW